ncbi:MULTISPECIES: type II toxin-antitoxin system RelE family toxin [unclassified Tolypothrix]|uniref:type II toxin-antitoxin system RelE family toxin n=1 Tax=unclassified Tolypothrix TaxID=2649714 RepID=UPI0005EAADFD|nr:MULTISPECIES: type II toxin-antitoxin system RelE/ParE family toxin [unclassified Tolypothrix]BAY90721.1 putative plasmid stability protein [Microchaete diplosiphon NIES-3275]EKF01482.1 plasmid stabilization system protein [Tolypothrix sp. PCC 7601]MBE9081072.1 type II toxin-antitoxin system RelE/ParE family toxin [Tolypothrix sp. LEGE 11397]UYD24864.1 type II toxin-antitoxin system RelE/ParE family toxin [Tolypothrix sp. PCC 7712]UYD32905.1 type II toxin-antitoxin system RelE/ParE family t
MYSVILSAEAEEIYASADQALAKKVVRCFEQLEQNPRFHPNIKPLKGDLAGYYRYRIGDYRVIYQVNDETNEVIVNNIAHRRDVYE